MEGNDSTKQPSSPRLLSYTKCSPVSSSPVNEEKQLSPRKHGGWKSMPYILGNETFERLATFGLLGNFMVYLLTQLHMDQVSATNVLNIWSGFTNFAPLLGAFISDAYVGRFHTIAYASLASFLSKQTDLNNDELKEALSNYLNERRYLIVMDDVWIIEPWDEAKTCFPDNNNGNRITVTSRMKEVALQASPNPPHFLGFLDNTESWELFSKKVF